MQIATIIAHAGVEHASEAEATAHQSNAPTAIIVISAVTVIVLVIVVRLLSRNKSAPEKGED